MIPELLSVKGKAMTKPVTLNEYDVKCALLKVPIFSSDTKCVKYFKMVEMCKMLAKLWSCSFNVRQMCILCFHVF